MDVPDKLESDQVVSMVSTISELKQTKQQLEQKVKQLKEMLDDLIGFDMAEKKCPDNHPLRYIVYQRKFINYYWCNKCKKKCDKVSNIRWTCKKCNYDECAQCGGFRKNFCPFMHKLHKQVLPKEQKTEKACDICLQSVIGTHYTCQCDFDICQKCRG